MATARIRAAVLAGVCGLAVALRVPHLGRPGSMVFDEVYYVRDALLYLGRAGSNGEISYVHPPLGKWLIAAGIAVGGDDPTGWRVATALAGVATVLLTYLLARRLIGAGAATIAALLVAVDGLSIVQSRTAMLDGFLPPLLLAGTLILLRPGEPPRERPWWQVALAGLAFGAAVAVKWSAGPVLLAAAVLLVVTSSREGWRRLLGAGPLVGAAAGAYLASYARFWADSGLDVRGFVRLHRAMLEYHQTLTETHPYGSRAWTWLPMRRPVAYFFAESDGRVQEVLAVGNPVLWWGFLALLPVLAWVWWRRRDRTVDMVVLGTACLYLPWIMVLRQGFLFYLTPFVPVMAIGVAWALQGVWRRGRGWRVPTLVYVTAAVVVGIWMLPIWVASPISRDRWDQLLLFDSWL